MKTKFKMKSILLLMTILIVAIPFFTGCPGASPADGTGDTETGSTVGSTNEEILQNLNMDMPDEDSVAVNGNDEEVTGTMNPLGASITTLGNIYELAWVGATLDGMGPYSLIDHSGYADSGFTVKSGFSGNEPWMSLPKKKPLGGY